MTTYVDQILVTVIIFKNKKGRIKNSTKENKNYRNKKRMIV